MEQITFNNIASLAEYMINRVENKDYIVATLFFDNAVELMRCLLLYDDVRVGSIEVADLEFDGYVDEYYVSITDDYTLCVERALSDGQYLKTDSALMLIDGDAKHAIVDTNKNTECIEIEIDDCAPDYDDYDDNYDSPMKILAEVCALFCDIF